MAKDQCKDIPDDLLFNIFMRLPIKNIGLCTCVSKSWQSVIKTHLFINNHLHMTTKNNTNETHHETRHYMLFRYPEVLVYSCNGSGKTDCKKLRYRASSKGPKDLVGCCNGLVCILGNNFSSPSYYYYHVLLWNPLINKIKIIKKSQFKNPEPDLQKVVLGFGFVGDFKVVKLEYFRSNRDSPRVEVYSLEPDSWRAITTTPHCRVIGNQEDHSPNSFVRGCIHWIADRGDKGRVILCFDMTREEFREIELPTLPDHSKPLRVTKFEESLALFVDMGSIDGVQQVDVWVMKDFGVGDSWSILEQLRPESGVEYLEIANRFVLTRKRIKTQKSVPIAELATSYEEGGLTLLNDGLMFEAN